MNNVIFRNCDVKSANIIYLVVNYLMIYDTIMSFLGFVQNFCRYSNEIREK